MTTKQDVLDILSADDEAQAERHLYKHTACGAWIEFNPDGIELGSIVEGCDFGTATYALRYADNFTPKDFWDRVAAIETEADALWKWANEGPEDSDQTWADLGLDAPDADQDFQHLNPCGRSS